MSLYPLPHTSCPVSQVGAGERNEEPRFWHRGRRPWQCISKGVSVWFHPIRFKTTSHAVDAQAVSRCIPCSMCMRRCSQLSAWLMRHSVKRTTPPALPPSKILSLLDPMFGGFGFCRVPRGWGPPLVLCPDLIASSCQGCQAQVELGLPRNSASNPEFLL